MVGCLGLVSERSGLRINKNVLMSLDEDALSSW